jgi:hypothetical protein
LGIVTTYRLRLQRQRWRYRAWRRSRDLVPMRDRTALIARRDVMLFAVLRNERARLPYFFDYYRRLGIGHFLIVDNGSDDGSREWLIAQPDVSVWGTGASYRRSRYGMDWLNWLKRRYAHDHWALTVDLDEFFVYPFCDTRPIAALTDWLDTAGVKSFGTLMLDMYPQGDPDAAPCAEGQDPFEVACWFDPGNYTMSRHPLFRHLWIQGGPRARVFFPDRPEEAPALNKIPLVKWNRRFVYASSTHMLLPRGLNLVYDATGGEKASGVLLHAKFLGGFAARADEELRRKEHFAQSREYAAYARRAGEGGLTLWCDWSERYVNWRQLELLGLMSKGNWA